MSNSTHKRMFENIYDLIKGGDFEEEARKELRNFIKHKNIECDGDNNTIKLGRDFIIKLERKVQGEQNNDSIKIKKKFEKYV